MHEIQQNNAKKCSENEKKKRRKIQNKNFSFESAHVTRNKIYTWKVLSKANQKKMHF